MRVSDRTYTLVFWLLLIVISLAGGYLLYFTTALAPWAFSDSTIYIASGINWVHGGGMGYVQADGAFARLLHYPPGYPVLIGITSLIAASPVEAARWINIICFTLLIFLGGWLIWRITSSRLMSLLYGILILSSPFLLMPFSGIMSESSAILAGMLALLVLGLFARTRNKIHLILAGLLAAGAILIRYQQVSIILSGGIFLLLIPQQNWALRLKQTLLYIFVSAGPFAVWLFTASLANENPARGIGIQGDLGELSLEFLQKTFTETKYWFPYRSGLAPFLDATIIRIIFVVGFLAVLIIGWLKSRRATIHPVENSELKPLIALSGINLGVYLIVLLVASLFTSPAPDINNRILSPLLPMLFILILGLEYLAARTVKPWLAAVFMIMTTAMFCVTFAPQVREYATSMHGFGEGYTSFTYKKSPLIAHIREISMARPIITNAPSLVFFYTLQDPLRTFEGTGDPAIDATLRYGDQSTPAQLAFSEQCGALVIFDPDKAKAAEGQSPEYYPPEVYGVTDGLIRIFEDPLGNIYLYPGCE